MTSRQECVPCNQRTDPPHLSGSLVHMIYGKICNLVSLGPSISSRCTAFAGDEGIVVVHKYKVSSTPFSMLKIHLKVELSYSRNHHLFCIPEKHAVSQSVSGRLHGTVEQIAPPTQGPIQMHFRAILTVSARYRVSTTTTIISMKVRKRANPAVANSSVRSKPIDYSDVTKKIYLK